MPAIFCQEYSLTIFKICSRASPRLRPVFACPCGHSRSQTQLFPRSLVSSLPIHHTPCGPLSPSAFPQPSNLGPFRPQGHERITRQTTITTRIKTPIIILMTTTRPKSRHRYPHDRRQPEHSHSPTFSGELLAPPILRRINLLSPSSLHAFENNKKPSPSPLSPKHPVPSAGVANSWKALFSSKTLIASCFKNFALLP